MRAAYMGHTEIVRLLIQNGADAAALMVGDGADYPNGVVQITYRIKP